MIALSIKKGSAMDVSQINGDSLVLDRLLSELSRRLDGAVDVWTLVFLGQIGPDPRLFLRERSEVLHSFVVVIKAILSGRSSEQRHSLLNTLGEDCRQFLHSCLALVDFQALSPDEVRAATEKFSASYTNMQDVIQKLGNDLGVPVSYQRTKPAEREDYHRRILDSLFEAFRQQRGEGQAALAPLPVTS